MPIHFFTIGSYERISINRLENSLGLADITEEVGLGPTVAIKHFSTRLILNDVGPYNFLKFFGRLG